MDDTADQVEQWLKNANRIEAIVVPVDGPAYSIWLGGDDAEAQDQLESLLGYFEYVGLARAGIPVFAFGNAEFESNLPVNRTAQLVFGGLLRVNGTLVIAGWPENNRIMPVPPTVRSILLNLHETTTEEDK